MLVAVGLWLANASKYNAWTEVMRGRFFTCWKVLKFKNLDVMSDAHLPLPKQVKLLGSGDNCGNSTKLENSSSPNQEEPNGYLSFRQINCHQI